MKKILLVVLSLVLALSFTANAFAFSVTCPECDRGNIYRKTVSATCVSDGYKSYECTGCSFSSYISVLRMTGHSKPSGVYCYQTAYCSNGCGKSYGSGTKHTLQTYYDSATGQTWQECVHCSY